MSRKKYVYFCASLLAALVLLNDVNAKSYGHSHHSSGSHHTSHGSSGSHGSNTAHHSKSSPTSHSYPTGGLSGSGHSSHSSAYVNPSVAKHSHSYPSSGTSSNSANKHSVSYPTSGGLSGGSSSYPVSSGLSGSGTSSGLSGSGSRNTGSSYPTSTGLSGSGSRNTGSSYPTSNGLSGNGNTGTSYPSSTGLSGSGSRNTGSSYPTSNHITGNGNLNTGSSYPSSNGLSGSGSRNTGTSYPSSNSGLSGSGSQKPGSNPLPSKPVTYPVSNGGLSGNTHITNYPPPSPPHVTNNYWEVRHEPQKVHHHYHRTYVYRPPTVIYYTPLHGPAVNYPVYTGQYLPPYVYEYRSSGNKYRQLLAGLALYNLGAVSNSHSKHHFHDGYVPKADEICRFGVQYKTGNYDEMAVDCRVITNFIWESESKPRTVSIVNQSTITNIENNQMMLPNGTLLTVGQTITSYEPTDVMLPNGTLVPAAVANTLQKTGEGIPRTQVLLPNGTLVDHVLDPKFNGNPVDVKSSMECYVTRTTRFSNMKQNVSCDLLQSYAVQSLRKNSAAAFKCSLTIVLFAAGLMLL